MSFGRNPYSRVRFASEEAPSVFTLEQLPPRKQQEIYEKWLNSPYGTKKVGRAEFTHGRQEWEKSKEQILAQHAEFHLDFAFGGNHYWSMKGYIDLRNILKSKAFSAFKHLQGLFDLGVQKEPILHAVVFKLRGNAKLGKFAFDDDIGLSSFFGRKLLHDMALEFDPSALKDIDLFYAKYKKEVSLIYGVFSSHWQHYYHTYFSFTAFKRYCKQEHCLFDAKGNSI